MRQSQPQRQQRRRLSDDIRAEVVRLADTGLSAGAIARQLSISQGSVHNIASAAGRTFDASRVKHMLPLIEAFHHERRLRIYAKVAQVAEDKLDLVLAGEADISLKELQALVTSVAIGNDKARLELGESTQNIAHNVSMHIYLPDNGRSIADTTLPAPDTAPALLPGPAADAVLPAMPTPAADHAVRE